MSYFILLPTYIPKVSKINNIFQILFNEIQHMFWEILNVVAASVGKSYYEISFN